MMYTGQTRMGGFLCLCRKNKGTSQHYHYTKTAGLVAVRIEIKTGDNGVTV